jgi:hypothetical protein
MYHKFWKGLPSNRPLLDINFPYYDLTPPIESIESIERGIKRSFGLYSSSGTHGFTMKDVKAIAEMERGAALREAKEREENGEPPLGQCCDECGEELGEESHEISQGILRPEEYLCDDCYRKRYGPYKCKKCGKECLSGEIDWENSDKEEDSYICMKCSWEEQYGDASEDEYDDKASSW